MCVTSALGRVVLQLHTSHVDTTVGPFVLFGAAFLAGEIWSTAMGMLLDHHATNSRACIVTSSSPPCRRVVTPAWDCCLSEVTLLVQHELVKAHRARPSLSLSLALSQIRENAGRC
jgi:hypothetical protein